MERKGSRTWGRRDVRPRFNHGQPIAKIDTRPMAVLAVALFAFLILLQRPAQHATLISLWDGSGKSALMPHSTNLQDRAHHTIVNRLTVSQSDLIEWNGESVTSAELWTILQNVRTLIPQPIIEFEPEPLASYDVSAKLIHLLNSSGINYQIDGLEQHCRLDRAHDFQAISATQMPVLLTVIVPNTPMMEERFEGGPLANDCPATIAIQRRPNPPPPAHPPASPR